MRKSLMLVSIILLSCTLFAAEKDLQLLKELTEKQIQFIERGENREVFRTINATIPKDAPRGLPKSAGAKPPAAFTPQKYDFSYKTVYGDFTVLVFEQQNSFSISFSSEYPVQAYKIVDTNDKSEIKQENLNDAMRYTININRPFKPQYVLILSMYKDEVISQNIIPLYKKANVKYK